MADFSALKTSIQNYIKQNGNEEITGNLLQQVLLSMVTTLGDSAINDLVTALNNEVSARQNADGTLQTNINNEATIRGNADTQLGNRITSEAEAREGADNTLRGLIDGIVSNIGNGYVYAGIATPSTTPASGKVFYLALTAGTYTNFGATVVPQGINILKYNGSAWSLDSFLGLDNAPTQGSNNLVKSGKVFDIITTQSNSSIVGIGNSDKVIKSITKSGTDVTIEFNTPIIAFGNTDNSINYTYVTATVETNGYTIGNTQALVFDFLTASFSVVPTQMRLTWNNNVSSTKIIVLVNYSGNIFSPIPKLQAEINMLSLPKYMIAESSTGFNIGVRANVAKTTAYITYDSFILTHTDNGGADITIPAQTKEKIVNNGRSIVYTPSTQTVSVKTETDILDEDIILITVQYGYATSPISGLNEQLFLVQELNLSNTLGASINHSNAIACVYKTTTFSITVVKNGDNATITTNEGFNLSCVRRTNSGLFSLPVISNQTINHTQCLVLDQKTGTLTVKESGGQTADDIVLFYCEYGYVYSPIPQLQAKLDEAQSSSPVNPTVTTITVDINGTGDYTSVRDAVKAINDATISNRYIIYVKNGTYNEIDIKTKDYVDIVGESKSGVILYCNGLSTENAPDDYNWYPEDYGGQPINTIPIEWKHLFIHTSNSIIKNMTLKVTQCKYVIHQDSATNEYDAIVENCYLIREDDYTNNGIYHFLVGVGAYDAQFQRFYDCDFVSNITNAPSTYFTGAILWHNWRNGVKAAGLSVRDCTSFGCGFFANVSNLRTTGVYDLVEFLNCDTDNPKANAIILNSVSSSAHPIVDGEYHIYCNLKGYTKLQSVMIDSLGVNYAKNSLSASAMKKVHISASVLKGQPIDDSSSFVLNGNVSKGIATATPFVVALENASSDGFCYCNKGDYFSGLCIAGNYAIGDDIYISNGKFTKAVSGSSVGKVVEAINLSADGLVKIVKQ